MGKLYLNYQSNNLGGSNRSGGMFNYENSSPMVTHCIFWDDSPNKIFNSNTSRLTVRCSDLQDGLPGGTIDGGGNIAVDPLFVDTDGPDNTTGTGDENLRLSGGSPCINRGSFFDFNRLFDLGEKIRYADEPTTINTGSDVVTFLDMGPYEFQVPLCSNLPGDSNCDGIANLLALHWLKTN